MRLVNKLSLAFMIGTTAILAGNGYFRVRREVGLFRADRVHDHELIGRTLGASLQVAWRSEGQAAAMALIDAANAGEGRVRFRWDWLDGAGASADLHVDRLALLEMRPGTIITVIAPDSRGQDERFTYAPLVVGDGRHGALELSETLDAERDYTRRTVYETMQTTGVLALVTALLSYVLGSFFVGRPVRALVEKARRIGRGEFGEPVVLASRDELAEVADELNATSDALVAANAKVARETSARIATLEQLRHADRLTTVGKLASGVAHELGTPLNVVVARAEMIAQGEASVDESREYARVIVSSAQKMTRIIRQLLEFARRRGPRKERRDVAPLVEHVLELLRPLAQRQNVTLALDASGGPYEADVDVGQIEQVLTNLVVNAVQAMPRGGPVDASVRRERAIPPADHGGAEGEWLAVRVRDAGEGIPPDVLPHVFEPFFTTKEVGTGTGLGLSVAHGIISDHGGWIAVESEPMHGSTFVVYLPPGQP